MRWVIVCAILLVPVALPTLPAQQPVEKCRTQCDPQASDVNFPPVRSDGPVNVILYAHVQDIVSEAPLNTIPPGDHEGDVDQAFIVPVVATPSVPCTVAGCASFHFKNNLFEWRSCPGAIDFEAEDRWILGCHSGQLDHEIMLAGATIPLYFYVSPDPSWGSTQARVGAMPMMGLHGRVYVRTHEGDVVIAQNARPQLMGSSTLVTAPNQPYVYELRADMRIERNIIPPDEDAENAGFRVGVWVYEFTTNDAEVSESARVHTGKRFPPRLILPMQIPMHIVDRKASLHEGHLRFEIDVADPLGAYNVDAATAQLSVAGSAPIAGRLVELAYVQRSNDHDGPTRPVRFGFDVYPPSNVGGDSHSFTFRVRNLQGTFELVDESETTVASIKGSALSAPGVGAFIMVVLASLAMRRRA